MNIGPLQVELRDSRGASLSDRCQEGEHLALADGPNVGGSHRACPRSLAAPLAETGSLSTGTGLSLAPAALSITKAPRGAEGVLVSHPGRVRMSCVKPATQKQCFHYAGIKYLQCFLILAWQFDKRALCEHAVVGTVT